MGSSQREVAVLVALELYGALPGECIVTAGAVFSLRTSVHISQVVFVSAVLSASVVVDVAICTITNSFLSAFCWADTYCLVLFFFGIVLSGVTTGTFCLSVSASQWKSCGAVVKGREIFEVFPGRGLVTHGAIGPLDGIAFSGFSPRCHDVVCRQLGFFSQQICSGFFDQSVRTFFCGFAFVFLLAIRHEHECTRNDESHDRSQDRFGVSSHFLPLLWKFTWQSEHCLCLSGRYFTIFF